MQNALDDVASNTCQTLMIGSTSVRPRMTRKLPIRIPTTLRQGLADSARYAMGRGERRARVYEQAPAFRRGTREITGCHLAKETRVQNALDDVASNICQALC